jgi:hypothetical protein
VSTLNDLLRYASTNARILDTTESTASESDCALRDDAQTSSSDINNKLFFTQVIIQK